MQWERSDFQKRKMAQNKSAPIPHKEKKKSTKQTNKEKEKTKIRERKKGRLQWAMFTKIELTYHWRWQSEGWVRWLHASWCTSGALLSKQKVQTTLLSIYTSQQRLYPNFSSQSENLHDSSAFACRFGPGARAANSPWAAPPAWLLGVCRLQPV